MKQLISAFLIMSWIISCDCPECVTFPEPLRLIYIDSIGINLLETEEIEISSISNSTSGQYIEFTVKDFVVRGSKEKHHIEILSEEFYDELINSHETFYINFQNGRIDTLTYGIEEVEGKCCSSFRDQMFIYNLTDLTGTQENSIGAYEIIVE